MLEKEVTQYSLIFRCHLYATKIDH